MSAHRPVFFLMSMAGLSLTLAACSTISQEECLAGDWFTLGQKDGRDGQVNERLERHQGACQRVGVTIDVAAYQRGRAEGLKDYCQVSVAYHNTVAGKSYSGKSYQGVCPAELEQNYLTGQSIAQPVLSAQRHVRHLKSQINRLQSRTERTERDIDSLLLRLAGTDDPSTRTALQIEIANARRRAAEQRGQLDRLQSALPRAEIDLEQAKQTALQEVAKYD